MIHLIFSVFLRCRYLTCVLILPCLLENLDRETLSKSWRAAKLMTDRIWSNWRNFLTSFASQTPQVDWY